MTLEELKRNLTFEMNKHKNDTVYTGDINISAMCRDVLDVLATVEKEIREQTIDECIKELTTNALLIKSCDALCGYNCAITTLKIFKGGGLNVEN